MVVQGIGETRVIATEKADSRDAKAKCAVAKALGSEEYTLLFARWLQIPK